MFYFIFWLTFISKFVSIVCLLRSDFCVLHYICCYLSFSLPFESVVFWLLVHWKYLNLKKSCCGTWCCVQNLNILEYPMWLKSQLDNNMNHLNSSQTSAISKLVSKKHTSWKNYNQLKSWTFSNINVRTLKIAQIFMQLAR